MNSKTARKIGGKLAIKSMLFGLFIAQCIMTLIASDDGILSGFYWFVGFHYLVNIIFAVIVSLITSYFIGQIAGQRILINGDNEILIGIVTGLLIVIVSSFFSGWIGFFQEGIGKTGTNDNPFYDYILKPIFITTLWGLVPIIIVGIIFGSQVKKHKLKEN